MRTRLKRWLLLVWRWSLGDPPETVTAHKRRAWRGFATRP
jgi:hypothetical protein